MERSLKGLGLWATFGAQDTLLVNQLWLREGKKADAGVKLKLGRNLLIARDTELRAAWQASKGIPVLPHR